MTELAERMARLSEDRRALLEVWLAAEDGGRDATPPRTDVERRLAAVWSDVLEVGPLGVHEDYFALGGDSVLSVVLVAEALERGLSFTTQQLFEHPTIAELAEAVLDVAALDTAPANERARALSLPLTPLQRAILADTLRAGGAAYVAQLACRLHGPLEPERMGAAWDTVTRRHDALRASFDHQGRWVQLVAAEAHMPFTVHDLSGLPTDERDRAIEDHLAADAAQGFDLARPPLSRVTALRLGEDEHMLVWTHHHLILDGWSEELVVADVLRAYAGAPDGAPPPDLRAYLDWLDAQDADGAARHWADHLAGTQGLPIADDADRDVRTVRLAVPSASFAPGARRVAVTLATAAFGAWALALAHRQGTDDVVFGTTVALRPPELVGATQMVGLLLNTVPFRVLVDRDAGLDDWLRALQVRHAEVRRHAHAPLDAIRRSAALPADHRPFESIVVVETFPSLVPDGAEVGGLRVGEVRCAIDEQQPLVLEVATRTGIGVTVRFDRARIATVEAEAMAEAVALVLASVGGGLSVGEVLERIAARRRELRAEESSRRDRGVLAARRDAEVGG